MKKTMKKLIALAVVFVMLLTAVPAFASGQSCIYGEDTVSAVFYPNQKMHPYSASGRTAPSIFRKCHGP